MAMKNVPAGSAEAKASGRPGWDSYMMELARLAASRSTCTRRQVGCIVERAHRLVCTGYNGSPSGAPHCTDAGCRRAGLQSGDRLDLCRAVHAEANAVAQAARHGVPLDGATAHVTCQPCAACARLLVQAGISRIVWAEGYPAPDAIKVLEESGFAVGGREARKVL